jgi:hypothetical protein
MGVQQAVLSTIWFAGSQAYLLANAVISELTLGSSGISLLIAPAIQVLATCHVDGLPLRAVVRTSRVSQ